MADLETPRPTTLHPGVDAQSWLGFEQRIQARRFDALIASARQAIACNNVVLAEHALMEAREMRPQSDAVRQLDSEIRALAPRGQAERLVKRAAGAMILLAAGVLMFVALDIWRIPQQALPLIAPAPSPLASVAPARAAVPLVAPVRTVASGVDEVDEVDKEVTVVPPRPSAPPVWQAIAASARIDTRLAALPTPDAVAPQEIAAAVRSTGVESPVLLASSPMAASPSPAAATALPGVIEDMPRTVEAVPDESSRVADVLRRYARAYDALDVSAAREVWPGVDERALSRAFDSLASQTVSLEDCQIAVNGATANASCRGQAKYVGKVGSGAARTEPRTWRFELRRDGETWKIANAEARRASGAVH